MTCDVMMYYDFGVPYTTTLRRCHGAHRFCSTSSKNSMGPREDTIPRRSLLLPALNLKIFLLPLTNLCCYITCVSCWFHDAAIMQSSRFSVRGPERFAVSRRCHCLWWTVRGRALQSVTPYWETEDRTS